jgi:transposase-like protein
MGVLRRRSLNAKLRRSVCSRGHFQSDESAMKLIWLHFREITQKWKMPPREWAVAKAQFAEFLMVPPQIRPPLCTAIYNQSS